MRVLVLLFNGLDRQVTSGHLLSAILKSLTAGGSHVHIIQKNTSGDLPSIPEEISHFPVTTDTIPFKAANKTNFVGRFCAELKYLHACKKFITDDYDAVFIQSTTVAGFAVKAIRKKLPKAIVTFNVQDIFPYNLSFSGGLKRSSPIFKILAVEQRYGYKHADHVITISEDMKDTLVADGVDANKIEVIYNWSYQDEPYENVDLTPVSHMLNPDYFNVVYAGNIGVMQNVDILIEAAKLMKADQGVWFHIIGNGVYKEKLEAKAKEYGITNISFWPMQPPELAPAIYSAADINVIPLVKDVYRTALPSKTATCLACGKPIIFAIGKDSKFGQKAMNEAGCPVVEADQAKDLVGAIHRVMRGETGNKATEFFLAHCRNTENSRKYAKIITGQTAKE